MVKQKLAGVEKITFGRTAYKRRSMVTGVLTAVLLAGLLYQFAAPVLDSPFPQIFLMLAIGVSSGILINLTRRNQIEINFHEGMHYRETGSWPSITVTGGRLSDISHIAITRILQRETISYAAYIVFHPEIKRASYRLDRLACSPRAGNFVDRFVLYLELATRLNVPVYDDSGWNGSRSEFSEPKVIVVQPGETHPALLHAPTKWKKW